MSRSLPINFVPKGWGFEKWIVNCEEYCGKLLYFAKDKKCSWHYHKIKDEVFYIQSGKILVKYSDSDDINDAKRKSTTIRPSSRRANDGATKIFNGAKRYRARY